MSDFLRFFLNHGIGGIALLVAVVGAIGLALLGLTAGATLAGRRFTHGFRQGLRDDHQDVG